MRRRQHRRVRAREVLDHRAVLVRAYDAVAEHLTPDEIAALVSLITTINAWNTIAVTTSAWIPGSYQP